MNKKQLLQDHYSSDWSYKKYVTVGLWDVEAVLLKRHLLSGSRVLELGCGGGRATLPLREMGFDITGVDVVPRMIEIAKENAAKYRVDAEFRVMDATCMDFPDASFDAVLFLYNGIESVPTDEERLKVIKESHRVLKDEGKFILVTHSIYNRLGCGLYLRKLSNSMSRKITLGRLAPFGYMEKLDYGDCISKWTDGKPQHILRLTNPLRLVKTVNSNGFRLVYMNSRNRVLGGKRSTMLSSFTNRTMYYVFNKTGSS